MFNELYNFCMLHNISMKIFVAELFKVEIQFQQGNWKISYKFDDLNELDMHYKTILNNMIERLERDSHKII